MKTQKNGRALFADRILAGAPMAFITELQPPNVQMLLLMQKETFFRPIATSEIIDASNVSDYYFSIADQKHWSLDDDFPRPIPPFQRCFVEFTSQFGPTKHRAGCFTQCKKISTETELRQFFVDSGCNTNAADEMINRPPTPENYLWAVAGLMLLERDNCPVPLFSFLIFMDKDGNLKGTKKLINPFIEASDSRDIMTDAAWRTLNPVLLAFSFMNCKNVKLVDESPDAKFSRVWQHKHKSPLTTYKTLEIEPMKAVLEAEGGIGQNGFKKALHICRGHFATYTPEKGMLGRKLESSVTVWKPAHTRGSSKYGEVKKDYRVKV